ncbi:MAG: tetratricopeptide repeat protein [Chlorobium sp.]|uniref:tetratricopeptide repeat protein n=1 Tax=Chlorobium sp. TaxID=1095 RepID=UPI0025BCDA48|nr:tetratricopeptide repeat protein [Chlorobium sp.]MCF8383638.1 tetratricopeptide repeat protein [Chlorobium sp.]
MNTFSRFFSVVLTASLFAAAPVYAGEDAAGYFASGSSKFDSGDYRGAIEEFTKVVELDPKAAKAFDKRGNAKMKTGDRPGAIADFINVIELVPQLSKVFTEGEKELDGEDEPDLHAVAADDLHADYAFAFDNRGLLRYINGNYREAIEDFTAAIALEPKFALPYKHRGYAKHDLQDYAGAIEDYSWAIRLDRKAGETYWDRGLAKEQAGDKEGALDDFRKAAKLGEKSAIERLGEQAAEGES